MTAIGYSRVSTDRQDNSSDAQEKKIRTYAEANGFDLIDLAADVDEFSGDLNRPGIQKVLELVRAGKVDAVIFCKLDRLTRSTRDIEDLMALFKKTGVLLIDISQTIDIESATGRFVVGMRALVAQFERETIGERTKEGLQNLKAQGFAAGPAPFGFTAQPRTAEEKKLKIRHPLVVNPNELEKVRIVNVLRAENRTWRYIADQLNAAGLRTRAGTEFDFHDTHRIWHKHNRAVAA
jgi:site-specific DNA recombinase